MQKSSLGALKPAEAQYNNGSASNADSLKAWQHERLSEGHNRGQSHVQNSRGKICLCTVDDRLREE